MNKQYRGLDTETPLGWVKVIATDLQVEEVETFEDIVAFLMQRRYRGVVFFTYNLLFDGEAILKTTNNMDFLKSVYKDGVKGIWYLKSQIKVRWIPRKMLQICVGNSEKTNHCIRIYDIAQFYGGWKLDKVARKFLGDYKNPVDAKRLGAEKGYYEAHKEEVKEYCRKDAELTLRVAQLIKQVIEETPMQRGKLSFRNPISQAKIAELYVRDNFKYPIVPKGTDIYHFNAWKSYHGGIFSSLKRGYIKKPLYIYDINSAYPYQMQNLPHWGNGRFEKVSEPTSRTRYGWYECEFNCEWIPYTEYGKGFNIDIVVKDIEVAVLVNPKRKVYPTGKRTQWLTKIEYEWMLNHGFYVNFIAGFEWIKNSDKYESPFLWIPDVYAKRKEIAALDEEDITQYAFKILLNSIYGKTAQAKKGVGELTNFFYASYITAGTRLQICDVALQNLKAIVEIATDSILSLQPLSVRVSEALGDWSFETYKKGLLIGSGIKQVWKTNDNTDFETSARGLTDKTDWNMLKEIVHGYNKKEKKPNIDCDYLYYSKNRPYHLGEVIYHHKLLTLNDLVTFADMKKKLNVNTDKKRRWARSYRNFRDLIESEPMDSEPLRI